MKSVLKAILLVAVFLVAAEVSEFVISAIPGTPNNRLQRELSVARQTGTCQWLGSTEAEPIMESSSAVKCLAILPFASFITGIVGALLIVSRKKVVVLTSVMYVCVVVFGYFGTIALYNILETIRCADGGQGSRAGYPTSLGIVLLFAGLAISCVAAWLGYLAILRKVLAQEQRNSQPNENSSA